MATKGFTKVDNCILLDTNLSLEAKGLYSILKHLSTIPGFKIARDYVKRISGYGETAFRRVWKELKEAGLVLENKLRNKGRYVYTYTLKTSESTSKSKAPEEKKHVDSDGNIPLSGQISVDEIIEKKVKAVVEATGFATSEASELLKETNNNVTEVLESYVYVKKQNNIKNLFNYTKWVVKNKSVMQSDNNTSCKVSLFNSFKQRNYDFDKLKKALLYGEPYELPV